jgi:tellurium resistance protein TerD
MSISLKKGENISLTKEAPNLTAIAVALGWDPRTTTGVKFDLDASAIATGDNKKVLSDKHFVFYKNLISPDGSIQHTGDNRDGQGDGDDETINVDLVAAPPTITHIFFTVSIDEAEERSQNFGQVDNAYIRVVDQTTGNELARYDLTEDAANLTAMVFGEVYRHGDEWKVRAIGQGYESGLRGIVTDYGMTAED